MSFHSQREYLNHGDVVEVACSHHCEIVLLDDNNFFNYKNARPFTRHDGGFFTMFPARLLVPQAGYWNIVIDLGGGNATIRHLIRIVRS